jgi:methyl-accepting chemotaxis protein
MFARLKISHRLLAGFGMMLALLALAVGVALWKVDEIARDSERIATLRAPTALTAERLTADLQGTLAGLRGYMLTGKDGFEKQRLAAWADIAEASAEMERLSARWTNPANVEAWKQFKVVRDEFAVAQERVVKAVDPANIAPSVEILVTEAAPRADKLLGILLGPADADGHRSGGMVDDQRAMLEADNAAIASNVTMLLVLQWTLLAVGLIAGAAISLVTARAIVRPIVAMTGAMERLADNQLDVEVPSKERGDEIGSMAAAVEVFKQNAIEVRDLNAADAQRNAEARKRAAAMAELMRALGEVVDAAVRGDFQQRIDLRLEDADLAEVARGVNELVSTVDRGVTETGGVLSALARTDLTARVTGDYRGAFAKLKDDTNSVVDNLTRVVGQLRQTSRTLRTATGEILSGANDLAERTTKQAAALEETSAAMEQLSHTVGDNAQRASQASDQSRQVSATAEGTRDVMQQANAAMERISSSSAKISNIIGLIDDIAFQTNLLALNASVEAARAGDAGKGFAVVAVEVRRLAQSAASASSDVKALIEQSSTEVAGGSKLVAQAGERLAEMLSSVRESTGLITAMSAASQEQSSAIMQISTAIRQMDEMTQHNAALVEETNAAIEQTEGQARELDKVVDVFVTVEGPDKAPAAAPKAARTSAPGGIKALQARITSAARTYLGGGSAAVAATAQGDWSEF